MTNTERFFNIAKDFQSKRSDARQTYQKRMADIADTKGSVFFDREAAAAEEAMTARISALREDASHRLEAIINDMAESNHERPMTPPSEEQTRIVSMLKLRDNPTRDEMAAAARACKDCPLALATLDEIARTKGLQGFNTLAYTDGTAVLPESTVDKMLETLRKGTRDFLDSDRVRAARISAEFTRTHYGTPYKEIDLKERPQFTDTLTMFREMGFGGIEKDTLQTFQDAVDWC